MYTVKKTKCSKSKTLTYQEAFDAFYTPVNLYNKRYITCELDRCNLCGSKSSHMRGIAIMDRIRLAGVKTNDVKVVECQAPHDFMYLCPNCHRIVNNIFFELWDAIANGDKKQLLDGCFYETIKLARKGWKKYWRTH